MQVYSKLLMKSAAVVLATESDFPSDPQQGQFCFKGGILYIYATVDTVTTWFPLTNRINYYVHTQPTSQLNWNIQHDLGSTDLVYMAYDENDIVQLTAGVTFVDGDNIILDFTDAISGKAVIFSASGSTVGGGTGSTSEFNAWSIKSANYTAAKGDRIMANTSGGSWTLTLPVGAATGDTVIVTDLSGTWATNNLIIATQSGQLIDSATSPLELDVRAEIALVYSDAAHGWIPCK